MYIIFSEFMKNKYIDNKILIKVILNMFKFNNYFLYFFKYSNKKTLEISTITLEYSISILDQN